MDPGEAYLFFLFFVLPLFVVFVLGPILVYADKRKKRKLEERAPVHLGQPPSSSTSTPIHPKEQFHRVLDGGLYTSDANLIHMRFLLLQEKMFPYARTHEPTAKLLFKIRDVYSKEALFLMPPRELDDARQTCIELTETFDNQKRIDDLLSKGPFESLSPADQREVLYLKEYFRQQATH